jgi:hypothetical protein
VRRFLHSSVWVALALLLSFAAAGSAEACAVCFQAKTDASRIAFIATTAAMTALPLLLIGGVVYWVRSRFRSQAAETAGQAGREVVAEVARG